ncbi:MAG: recombination protein RecR [Bacteroidetes bacterium]|nr:recombination protein RecR [Bacteroidota bacterium]
MNYPSETIANAVEQLSRFPGVGKKTALRLVLYLLRQNPEDVKRMSEAMNRLKTDVKYCEVCGNISDQPKCRICLSPRRDASVVCVVRDFQDIMAIENTGQYSGVYHVLGGVISPLEGIGPDEIRIAELIERVDKGEISEVLLALSANMEGDTTSFYIARKLETKPVKISAIARGISVGGELEYADEITLGRSIMQRIPYRSDSEF